MYVAVKGGEEAIANAHKLLSEKRRGDRAVPELEISQIKEQLGLSVDRVMTEGSLYDRELAAIAIKQAQGDLVEAIFLLRAYRTTLPRFGFSKPIETTTMEIQRRISSSFKDIPGAFWQPGDAPAIWMGNWRHSDNCIHDWFRRYTEGNRPERG